MPHQSVVTPALVAVAVEEGGGDHRLLPNLPSFAQRRLVTSATPLVTIRSLRNPSHLFRSIRNPYRLFPRYRRRFLRLQIGHSHLHPLNRNSVVQRQLRPVLVVRSSKYRLLPLVLLLLLLPGDPPSLIATTLPNWLSRPRPQQANGSWTQRQDLFHPLNQV